MLKTIGLVGLGGGFGCMARYLWIVGIMRVFPDQSFPLGTLGVNMAGSFLAGLLMMFLAKYISLEPLLFPLLVVGFCGGFTTFSTFSLECLALFRSGMVLKCFIYMVISVLSGIVFSFLGFFIGKKL